MGSTGARLLCLFLATAQGCLFTGAVRRFNGETGASGQTGSELLMTGAVSADCPGVPSDPLAPVLFFSDLESGPSTGGENGDGVFVTLYGERFGAAHSGALYLAGAKVAHIVDWA